MMNDTTPHFRHFQRLLTKRTRLYTEMHVVNGLAHMESLKLRKFLGDPRGTYDWSLANSGPVALQIGGADSDITKTALTRLWVEEGYRGSFDEVWTREFWHWYLRVYKLFQEWGW